MIKRMILGRHFSVVGDAGIAGREAAIQRLHDQLQRLRQFDEQQFRTQPELLDRALHSAGQQRERGGSPRCSSGSRQAASGLD